jgi:hypothetical protein
LVVVGGMLFSTFLTLIIIPVVYTLLARFTSKFKIAKEESVKADVVETDLVTE